ncbi:DUF6401 family natural product biosynthesis protein [Spirilliplanes yamanashiensis]|nr:DUF6401 family natural product biosynthesis protein [Spirilliplanes yamanashiensis]MDP9818128.1 hypothetical protein [Spirilliplanes yamanashiensis]
MGSHHDDDLARDDRIAPAVLAAAQLALGQWRARLGATGMAALKAVPGLLAEVDQHAAHVRDALADGAGRVRRVLLAAYADGVADRAAAAGWSADEVVAGDWRRASWPSVRLLAVCVLAESAV